MTPPNLETIRRHLEAVARPRDVFENRKTLEDVQSYIETEWTGYGYRVQKHPFEWGGLALENLVAFRPPRSGHARFVIAAHFDAVPGTDGADDNASGVAGLLECARLLAPTPAAGDIDFIAFNAEEYNMIGSTAYVEELKRQRVGIAGMLSLEMIGYTSERKGSQQIPLFLKPFYPDTGNFIALVGDGRSTSLLKAAREAFRKVPGLPVETLIVPAKGWLIPETRLSDHSPFWDAGYPALLVTDTSFFRNPHYHTPRDRIETLHLEFLGRVVEGIVNLALTMPSTF